MTRISPKFWDSVARDLHGDALEWWDKNKSSISDLARADAYAVFESLKNGSTIDAKYKVSRMLMRHDRRAWVAYQNNTLDQLTDIAKGRIELLRSLEFLGVKIAEMIGEIALRAIKELD